MSRYLVGFAIGYAAVIGICALLSRVVPALGNFASLLLALVGGACAAIAWFLKDRQRRPTGREMTVLVLGSLVVSLLVSAVMVAIFLFVVSEPEQADFMIAAAQALSPLVWLLGLLVVCAASVIVLYLTFAGYALMWSRRRAAATGA